MLTFLKQNIAWLIVAILSLLLFTKACDRELIKVPVTVEVEIPAKSKIFEQVVKPVPVKKVYNTKKVEEYKKTTPEEKEELFTKAVEVNNYEKTFEDEVQTIKVKAEVSGELNSLDVSYETKPIKKVIKTTAEVKVNLQKRSIMIYTELGHETGQGFEVVEDNPAIVKVGIDYKTRNKWVYGASYDTQKRIWVKVGKAFDF